jgi:hypothetical protein
VIDDVQKVQNELEGSYLSQQNTIEETGDKIKMKEIAADKEVAYKEYISKAEKLVAEKKYHEAKTHYQKALEIKPGEEQPKQKIEKIDSILGEIEQIHNSTF